MPRRNTIQNQNSGSAGIRNTIDSTQNSMLEETDPKIGFDFDKSGSLSQKGRVKEHFNILLQKLDAKKNYVLRDFKFAFNLLMVGIPEKLLNTSVDVHDERLRDIFFKDSFENNKGNTNTNQNSKRISNTVKRRRSKSARNSRFVDNGTKKKKLSISQRRSSSLDSLRTPVNKVLLTALTSAKKYTVSKPSRTEDSGFSLKRIMKPNEEAISLSGSPLIVHPNIATAPTVNIPLPGGVMMNIEPKKPRGKIMIPELDERTKQQLKILCEQIHKMC